MKVKTLNNESLRSEFTAFEAEALKHAAQYCAAGETFTGVPSSKESRYNNSAQRFEVMSKDDSTITLLWIDRDRSLCARIIPDGAPTTSTTSTTSNNNNNKTPDSMTTNSNSTTSNSKINEANTIAQFYASIKADARAEFQAQINDLLSQLAEATKRAEKLEAEAAKTGKGTVINITLPNGTTRASETKRVMHPNFARVLRYVGAHKNVYLYGPAGSGKNVVCEEVAKALGVPFYYQNTVLTKFDVTGYKNAIGEFEDTEFYKAWTGGGVFMLDEVDNSTAEALIALNAALANGYYTFPGLGRVYCHKDFYCVAAGNTNGQGATNDYCGRYKMDESSRDRFAFVKIDYCSEIEESIVPDDKRDVLDFVRAFRAACKATDNSIICGYRALSNLVEFYDCDPSEIIEDFILRGCEKDMVRELAHSMGKLDGNRYAAALNSLANM